MYESVDKELTLTLRMLKKYRPNQRHVNALTLLSPVDSSKILSFQKIKLTCLSV